VEILNALCVLMAHGLCQLALSTLEVGREARGHAARWSDGIAGEEATEIEHVA